MYSNDQASQGPFSPKITVVGVGGAGGNAVNNMIASKLDGVNFLVVNTDAQALENSLSQNTLQLGTQSTGGLGAGARPEIGRAAAEETLNDVMEQLRDQNMVFITAGMGGGTGTGAAPVIAEACKEAGILTVGVVTKPFQFEGQQRMRLADSGIDEMAQYVDTLIVIPNQNLFRIANEKTTFAEAFRMADNVLQSGVRGVTDLMVVPGMINLDFADVRSATSEMGKAMMGTGEATGDRRAIEAAEQAINNPLLDDVSMKGARSVIINITGGHDLTLFEIEEACNRINDEVDPDATIIFGSTYDDSLEGVMRVTVVATGIEAEINRRVATRPIRATNTNAPQIKQTEVEPAKVSDSFTARYPEPSRVGQQPLVDGTNAEVAMDPVPTSMPSEPTVAEPQVAVATTTHQTQSAFGATTDTNSATPTTQDIGTIETNYVTDGNQVRKIEVNSQENTATSYNENVIPPYAPPRSEQTATESNITLNPPAHPMVKKETKKTPSLFERITGRQRAPGGSESQDDTTTTSSSGESTTMPAGLTAERKTVVTAYDGHQAEPKGQQGVLNIETPTVETKTNSDSENLDIPAFLRRQIS